MFSMPYRPERILIEEEALDYRFCQRVLKKFPDIQTELVKDTPSFNGIGDPIKAISKGKRTLLLKVFKGNGFKLCPGFTDSLLCCNYYVLDLIENCPLECAYCILQAFLNKPIITFHVNVENIVDAMIETIQQYPDRPLRIGTGEHSDSLALDHLFDINPYLVERFAHLSHATLELKTKTDAINALKGLNHGGRTVVAWSLNPEKMIQQNEHKTATLKERLEAAAEICEEGYKVAFHFDPLIFYEDWEDGYFDTIEWLRKTISPKQIAWISLGTLRYIPKLKQIAEERFPKTAVFSNEFIASRDGKMRYVKPIRRRMLSSVSGWLEQKLPGVPLYLCMESYETWSRLYHTCPADPLALERYLHSNM